MARIRHNVGSYTIGNREKSKITVVTKYTTHHSSRPDPLTKKFSALPASYFPAVSSLKPGNLFFPGSRDDFVSQTAYTRVHFFFNFSLPNPEIKKFSPPHPPTVYFWKSRNKINGRPALTINASSQNCTIPGRSISIPSRAKCCFFSWKSDPTRLFREWIVKSPLIARWSIFDWPR